MPESQPVAVGRDEYLARVASAMDLPPELAAEPLEEIAGHLDDATAGLRAAGVDAADAERRAAARLGEPETLGREIGEARRGGRHLLAAVGGAVWGLFVDGIRAYLMIALAGVIAAPFAVPLAVAILNATGRGGSSFLAGPSGSLLSVVLVLVGGAAVAWTLPMRVAPHARRSVAGVRRGVAVGALLGGSVVLWAVPSFTLDPVLAVGYPLVPVVMALVAWRAPERPTFRIGLMPALIGGLVLIPVIVLGALLSAGPSSEDQSWEADLAPFGVQPEAIGVSVDGIQPSLQVIGALGGRPADASIVLGDAAGRVHDLRVEVWPAAVRDGRLVFGPAPLVVAPVVMPPEEAVTSDTMLAASWQVPALRDPVATTTFLLGTAPDGRGVLLAEDLWMRETPVWRGTLLDWWFGG